MITMKRKNTITYSTENRNTPELRLRNKYLENCGFKIGDKIIVEYEENKITITKEFPEVVSEDQFKLFVNE